MNLKSMRSEVDRAQTRKGGDRNKLTKGNSRKDENFQKDKEAT